MKFNPQLYSHIVGDHSRDDEREYVRADEWQDEQHEIGLEAETGCAGIDGGTSGNNT